jgi:hypothetical protein
MTGNSGRMLWLWLIEASPLLHTGRQTLTTVGRLEVHMHSKLGHHPALAAVLMRRQATRHDPPMSKPTKRSVHGHAG